MQARQAVRKAIRSHPRALIVVTGCYAQVSPQVLQNIPGVHWVVGNTFKSRILELVKKHQERQPAQTLVDDLSRPCRFQDMPVSRFGSRTRPFLKIQDGCDAFCSYCIIPHARGRSRSLAPQAVIKRIESLKEQGYDEVVLCGINLGRYGLDLDPPTSLSDLVRAMDNARAPKRVRLSSIEPTEVSEELVARLLASARICRHLHIPLQSGDEEILKRMNRPYGPTFYRELIHEIAGVMPDTAIGVDVMAGFPGETEAAFDRTCRLIEELPLAYLHVFPFSAQKGTAADGLSNRVSPETIKRRAQVVRELGETKRRLFYERAIGSTMEILVEGKRDRTTGCLRGLSGNYVPVHIEGPDSLFNQLVMVKATRVKQGRVFGERLPPSPSSQ
jgi:threonylcarbamoyladenosine tRNA methylthiotransferase MtaB